MKVDKLITPGFTKLRYTMLHVLFVITFFSLMAAGQQISVEKSELIIGVKTEKAVTGQAEHDFFVELKRGQVLRCNFIEKGANIRVIFGKVTDKFEPIYGANSGHGGFMQENMTAAVDQDGIYGLMVVAEQVTDQGKQAGYEFTASLVNTSAPEDLQRIQAEKLMLEVVGTVQSLDKEKMPAAISKLEEIVKIRRGLGDRYSEAIAKMYLGDLYGGISDFTKSETNFLAALNLFDKSQNKAEIGYLYASLGGIYLAAKNTEKSRTFFTQAQEIFNTLGDRQLAEIANAGTSGNLAEFNGSDGNKKLADYDKELETAIAKKNQSVIASTWAKVIFAYSLDDDDSGIDFSFSPAQSPDSSKTPEQINLEFNQKIEEQKQKIEKQRKERAEKKRNLYERAESEGLRSIKSIKDKNLEVQLLVALGVGYSELDYFQDQELKEKYQAKSINYLTQGLALAKIQNNQLFEMFAYVGFFNYYDEEVNKLSVFFGKKAINSLQTFRQTLKLTGDKELQQDFTRQIQIAYSAIASKLSEMDRLPEALQVLNFGRDQEFYEFSPFTNQPSAKLVLSPLEQVNEPKFEQLVNSLKSRYSNLSGASAQISTTDSQSVFKELEENFAGDASHNDAAEKVDDFEEMKDSLKKLEEKTGKKHATIYFDEEDGDVLMLLVTPRQIMAFSGESSDQEILEFLKLLTELCPDANQKPIPCYDPRPLGAKIYKGIFEAQRQIKDVAGNTSLDQELEKYGTEVIHWSLDGKMRYIPIDTLYDEKTNQYVLEKYENAVFTRGKKERFLSESKVWNQGLGLGTSVGYTIGNLVSSPLPHVPQEIHSIFGDEATQQKGFFNGRALLNKAFTRQSLLSIAQSKPDFVHIASHFRFQPGDSKNSFLLLGDGSAFSLFDMSRNLGLFAGVDLLTLSACQTAAVQSDESTGKEVDGLAELAQYLGAGSVIATLWEVDDQGTSNLMMEFYRIRKENPDFSKSEVLRLAQLKLLNGKSSWAEAAQRRSFKNGKSNNAVQDTIRVPYKPSPDNKFEHPYYWAPFVYYGSSTGSKKSEYIESRPKPQNNELTGVNSNAGNSRILRAADLIGTWEGLFDQQQYACTLEIERVEGNTFTGTLKPQGARIAVSGFIDPSTRQISFIETQILTLGNFPTWSLGSNRGTLSSENMFISGTGFAGSVSYNWSFRKSGTFNGFNGASHTTSSTVTLSDIESSFKNSQYDETIRLSQAFLQKTPESKEANYYAGVSFLLKKDSQNAVPLLVKAAVLGQPVPFPTKRLRIPLLGHLLEESAIVVSSDGIAINNGGSLFRAKFTDLTEGNLQNYDNQCNVAHLKGLFTETIEKTGKIKQDKKQFDLFPPGTYLVPKQQGQIVLNFAACSAQENYITEALMNVISQLANRRN